MIEPLPRWARWFLAAVAAAALTAWVRDDGVGPPAAADWQVARSAVLAPDTRAVPIVVTERSCASGRPAYGRVEATVTYGPDEVAIDVAVRRLRGDQDCPSNPGTDHVVHLREPLGDRPVTGERPPR